MSVMAETPATAPRKLKCSLLLSLQAHDVELPIDMLKERYKCPHFRILIIGRANAGKTTILEKVCGVAKGTKPVIYDKNGVEFEGKNLCNFLQIQHLQ